MLINQKHCYKVGKPTMFEIITGLIPCFPTLATAEHWCSWAAHGYLSIKLYTNIRLHFQVYFTIVLVFRCSYSDISIIFIFVA